MRLTTKGRLAVTAMVDVALHQKAGPVALTAIARRQRISMSYLEQMFADLRRHGLVASTRGPGGGYAIGRALADITVADIVFAVDRVSAEPGRSTLDGAADGNHRCLAPELWTSLSQCVVEFLDSIDLKKLVDDQIASGWKESEARKRAEPVKAEVKPSRPVAPNSVFELGRFLAR